MHPDADPPGVFRHQRACRTIRQGAGLVACANASAPLPVLDIGQRPVEVLSALCRRRGTGELADRDLAVILSRIRRDRVHWELVEVSPLVLGRSEELIQVASLRTLDAIHVASALAFQSASGFPLPFVTGDTRQREALSHLGLEVIWVG